MQIEWIVAFLALGCVVGFMAGLLGIGGGAIMVPVLTTIFIAQGIAIDKVVHLALGTSMACIIVTSISSFRAHHAKGAVIWPIVKQISIGVLFGTFLATFIAAKANSLYLATFFACFMALVAVQMFVNRQPKPHKQVPGKTGLIGAGTGIGGISALVSIGGGSLTVPYLVWHNVDIKKAIGTSAAIGFPISVAGSAGYILNGWHNTVLENYTLGFVYLPAVLFISATSFFVAPIGVKCAHVLPVGILKKVFAILMIVISFKMVHSII